MGVRISVGEPRHDDIATGLMHPERDKQPSPDQNGM